MTDDHLYDDYDDMDKKYVDWFYELFDYVPKKKGVKYILTYTGKKQSKSSSSYSDTSMEAERMRYNMYIYDTYHGREGWEYNLLTGRLEKKKEPLTFFY